MTLVFDGKTSRYTRRNDAFGGFGLHLDIPATALLGPSGAGKSTLTALAPSQLRPHGGRLSYNDLDPVKRREKADFRRQVAWIPQQVTPPPGLTVGEEFAYAGRLKGMHRSNAWQGSERAIDRVGLGELADRKSHPVSEGRIRRRGIAAALTHRSTLTLMNEPTSGLDPQQRWVFRRLVEELTGDVQALVSTHQPEDLYDLYSQVVVPGKATVPFQGTAAQFHELADHGESPRAHAESAYTHLVGKEV
ncbi:ATP-binding cassette domain-containing protein [Streptomyces sp. NPDC091027]|uniref:ATP-binding cassette domain-containing protein n=1 Tax=Streptomyces sp. NPDC091027 TaxID=3365971 RepID=UPI00382CDAB8